MLKNYFKIAWRNLLKNKKSSLINISGLAIGMAVAMLIGLWIWDELTFDKYHTNYDRVAQVMQHQTWNGTTHTGQALPFPLGEELRNSYGDNFKYLAMASWEGDHMLSKDNKHLYKNGIYIDKDGPRILSLQMTKGSADGLTNPNSILLSESTAKAFFGNADPMDQPMKIDNKLNVKVTGVFKDLPYSTTFRDLKFIAPWDLYKTSEGWLTQASTQWGNNSFQAFAQINDNVDFASVNRRIEKAKLNKVDEDEKKFKAAIFLHPMKDWHLRSSWKEGKQAGGQIEYVWMFAVIGVFVLLLACINFMNLSTARSEKRAKEVGIRKTVGSVREQLIGQFLCESILVAFIAFAFSVLLTQPVLPWFNQVAGKQIHILWGNGWFWLAGLGFTIITGLVAGSYPAFYLSSFKPVKVLKGTFKAGRFAALPRKVLVVTQFAVSVALIICTIIVYQQIQHTKNRPVGYDRNNLVMIYMQTPDFYGRYDVLRTELKKQNAIVEMSESSSPVTNVWSNNGGFNWEGKDPNLDTDFATFWVTAEYGKTVGFEIKEGRDFSHDFKGDSASLIINEAAIKFMNIKDPIGKIVRWENGYTRTLTIIGIVKDMVMASPYQPVKQAVYLLTNDNVNVINLKLNPQKSTSESLAIIEKVFKQLIPAAPFDYQFADQEYAKKFSAEVRVGKLAGFFTILAIIISCLGLFGLASFVAEQRTKEIGIRKIVGASVFNLWTLLSKDFVILVSISCMIAIPLAWYYLYGWLQHYDYRVGISWWVFVGAVGGAIGITLLTVSFQAIKAAMANPVKSLRTE
ncbi:ABC transporter permease [Terrimonas sp.]|uniref:ABC transporter permease n=1 Tax=Terrimonas sp. TaxID=1914338 RepID=UPI000D520E4F|nr:ABC transporter permease [Terrimonas sp.]PVD50432.1 ABC transporter permease [Terrimonas sp.]